MIKNLSTFFVGIALSCLAGCTPIPKETTATKEYAPLEVPVPERPAGQQDVIELTTPKRMFFQTRAKVVKFRFIVNKKRKL